MTGTSPAAAAAVAGGASPATAPCVACLMPVELPEPHVTLTQQIETERDGVINVLAVLVVAHLHTVCANRIAPTKDNLPAFRRLFGAAAQPAERTP